MTETKTKKTAVKKPTKKQAKKQTKKQTKKPAAIAKAKAKLMKSTKTTSAIKTNKAKKAPTSAVEAAAISQSAEKALADFEARETEKSEGMWLLNLYNQGFIWCTISGGGLYEICTLVCSQVSVHTRVHVLTCMVQSCNLSEVMRCEMFSACRDH